MTGRPINDLTGLRFGRLKVLKRVNNIHEYGKDRTAYLCQCTCGQELVVSAVRLKAGMKKSCGCLRRDRAEKLRVFLKGATDEKD